MSFLLKRLYGRGDKSVEDSLSKAGLTITQMRTFSERMQERDQIVQSIKIAKEKGDPLGLIEAYDDLVVRIGIPFHRSKDTPSLSRGIGAWNDQVVRAYWLCHWLPYSEWTPALKALAGEEAEVAREMEEELRKKMARSDPKVREAMLAEMRSQRATLVAAVIKLLEADANFIVNTSFAGIDIPHQTPLVIHGVPPAYGGSSTVIPTETIAGSRAKPPDTPIPGKVPRDKS